MRHVPSLSPSLLLLAAAPLLLAAAPVLLPLTARAAEPVPAADTTLTVTATRLDDAPIRQPYALHTYERDWLDARNARTLTDALNYTPGVYIQRTAPNQASPYLRGLTGEQTLLLFDGVRLNNALFRSGPNQYAALIPDEAIERIDVILGSATTVTGSDGLTGALDFRLAPAGRDVLKPMSPWLRTRVASAEGYAGAAGVDGRVGNWAYSFEGSAATYGNLKGGDRASSRLFGGYANDQANGEDIPNTSYDQYSGGARVAYLGVENQRFELAAGRVMQFDAERPDGYFVNSGNSARLSRYYNPQAFDYLHARHVARQIGPFDRVQTTLWAHESREHQVREDLEGTGAATRYRRRVYDDRVRTLGADVQLTNVIASHRVTYGATAYRDVIGTGFGRWRSPAGNTNSAAAVQDQTDGSNPGQTTVPDGSTFRGLGLFAQDSWQVHEDWELLGGLRFDRYGWNTHVTADRAGYASYGTTAVSDHAQALTAQARAAWHPVPEATLYAGFGQGFRAATISDLAGIQDRASSSSGGTGPQTIGNPTLKPERSLTIETGAKWQDGYDSASVGVFRTALRDLIQTVYTDVNGDGQITAADRAEAVNANGGVLQGFELANDLGLPVRRTWRLSFYQATSLVSGEADVPQANLTTRREHISRANQLFGYAGLKFANVRQWYGAVQMRWSDAYDEPAPSDATDTRQTSVGRADGSLPGWAVADLKAGWHTPDRRFAVDLTLENLFDVTYRAVGSGVDGAGFNIVLGGAARF